MSATILVRAGKRYYKVRVNPFTTRDDEIYAQLCNAYVRQIRKGRLASAIRIERKILKFEEYMSRKKK